MNNILIPTSMVGNYPNPRWWDADFARYFKGDQQPPDANAQGSIGGCDGGYRHRSAKCRSGYYH